MPEFFPSLHDGDVFERSVKYVAGNGVTGLMVGDMLLSIHEHGGLLSVLFGRIKDSR